ncbi:MAG: hypothetical protein HS116_17025 [Planctomycetes bacterium]|nr:hypothetical protein [Planctomycetota bacterium]
MRLARFRSAWLLGCALAAVCACAQDEPKLPDGIEKLDPAIQARLEVLVKSAERYRGLALPKRIAMGQLDTEALKKKVLLMFKDELPAEKMEPIQRTYKAFGLMPAAMDLNVYYPELLTSQIGGFYEPKEKYLVLVKGGAGVNAEIGKRYGAEMGAKMDDIVMVHEITHAIQDQHYDLQKFGHDTPLSDAAAAKLALIEGDATLVMYSHFYGLPMETLPMVDAQIRSMGQDPKALIDMMPEMPGSKEMSTAPAVIRDNLLFSYIQGLGFCLSVRKAGGQKLLDHAFKTDPPRSSEQILHPEKWIFKRDDPILLKLPDLAAVLPGYAKLSEGSWGEFNTQLVLVEKLGAAARARCQQAAEGWGGDLFGLYVKDGDELLAWITDWDGEADAREFEAAARQGFKAEAAADRLVARQGARVIVVAGSAAQKPELAAALFAAPAERPAAKNIDFAALGIAETDKPKQAGFDEMLKLLNDPAVQKMMQDMLGGEGGGELQKLLGGAEGAKDPADAPGDGLDLNKLMNDPNLQKMAEQMLKGEGQEGGGMDLGKLLNDPNFMKLAEKMLSGGGADDADTAAAMEKMAQQMLANQPKPAKGAVADGVYRNEKEGVELKQPKAAGWTFSEARPEEGGELVLAQLESADGAARVGIVQATMPMAVPIEMMPMSLEMGLGMRFKNLKKHKSGFIESAGRKGHEIEFSANDAGRDLHVLQHTYIVGNKMIAVTASSPEQDWKAHEEAIREAIGSFKFIAPPAAQTPAAPQPKKDEAEVLKE